MLLLTGVLVIGCRTPKKSVSVWSDISGSGSGCSRGSASRESSPSAPEQRLTEALLHPATTNTTVVASDKSPTTPSATSPTNTATATAASPGAVVTGKSSSPSNTAIAASGATNPEKKTATSKTNPKPDRESIHLTPPYNTNAPALQASSVPLPQPLHLPNAPRPDQPRSISLAALAAPASASKSAPSSPRLTAGKGAAAGNAKPSNPVTVSVDGQRNSDPQLQPKSLAVPEAADAARVPEEPPAKPIYVEPILDGSADEAQWRDWQLARKRAEEKAQQAERDKLSQTVQQFLQRDSK